MHPLHEGQPRAGHPHHAGPHPEAALLAVRQDPQGGVQVLLLPAVLVVSPRQGLLGHLPHRSLEPILAIYCSLT